LKSNDDDPDVEVLGPEKAKGDVGIDVLAHFGDHYSERPDLLIQTLEN